MTANADGESFRSLLSDLEEASRRLRRARRRALWMRVADFHGRRPLEKARAEVGRLRRWAKKLVARAERLGEAAGGRPRWIGFAESGRVCAERLSEAASAADELSRLHRAKARHGVLADVGLERRTTYRRMVRAEKRLSLALRRAARLQRLWLPTLDELSENRGVGGEVAVAAATDRLAEIRRAMSRVHSYLGGGGLWTLVRPPDSNLRLFDLVVSSGLLDEVDELLENGVPGASAGDLIDQAGRWRRAIDAADVCLAGDVVEDLGPWRRPKLDLKALGRFHDAYRSAEKR